MAQESNLLLETPMLDYSHPSIQALIQTFCFMPYSSWRLFLFIGVVTLF